MQKSDWRPSASVDTLKKRADIFAGIRAFFSSAGIMEVDTPSLGQCGVTDLNIDCIEALVSGDIRYLQSSPEYFMKRLLAAGAGPIYSLGKVFRNGESGRRHRPEFTLLEWYRPGWDEYQLMEEVSTLITGLVNPAPSIHRFTYSHIFLSVVGLNPHSATIAELQRSAARQCGEQWGQEQERSTLLDLLFSFEVEPRLPPGLVFIRDYPSCQAALARLSENQEGEIVARRFEVFLNGMELGNGYFELVDAEEQRQRFEADLRARARVMKTVPPVDEAFLGALKAGLPECAGVAIGVDRLLMQILGFDDIARVLPFGGP